MCTASRATFQGKLSGLERRGHRVKNSMAASGSRLSIPKDPNAIEHKLPEIGEVIERVRPHKSLQDALMKEFGAAWKIHWKGEPSENGLRSVLECLELGLPIDFFIAEEGSLGWTNDCLPSSVAKFTSHEYAQCMGVLIAKCLIDGPIKDLWNVKDNGLLRPFRLGERFGLPRDRFLEWVKYLKLCHPNAADTKARCIEHFIKAFNEHRKKTYTPGSGIVLDESISAFRPFFENTPEGIQWLTKIIRKPRGVGAELKNSACGETGVMLWLELQEGKPEMEKKKYCDRYPKHVALVLRLSEFIHGQGKIVYGDSYFASLQSAMALLERGTYSVGMLKTASAGFPKKFLHGAAWKSGPQPPQRGDIRTVRLSVDINGEKRSVFGVAWNEPGKPDFPKKVLVASCHTTLATDPHVKKRFIVNPNTGWSEPISRTVPWPEVTERYFKNASVIDVHNHMRQGVMAIEEHVGTKDHIYRLFTTIFGMCIVDAFKFYFIANKNEWCRGLKKFLEAAAMVFFTNRYPGCDNLPEEGRRLRKRGAEAMMAGEEEGEDSDVHSVVSVKEWKIQHFGASSLSDYAKNKATAVRCKVEGCGNNAYYCCILCSNRANQAVGVCGPQSGRDCVAKHAHAMALE